VKEQDFFEKEVSPKDAERAAKLIAALGFLGMSAELTSVLAKWAGIERSLDAMRYLRGPIVVHQTRWLDTIPKWLFAAAKAERHEIVFGKSPYIVGPAEITAVMYPAAMEHPLSRDAVDLYLWAGANAVAMHKHEPIEKIWQGMECPAIRNKEVIIPGGRLWYDYSNLSHEIRRRVVAEQTQRERASARSTKETKEKPEPAVVGIQLSLFT
jgi:hypothetical protein